MAGAKRGPRIGSSFSWSEALLEESFSPQATPFSKTSVAFILSLSLCESKNQSLRYVICNWIINRMMEGT